MDCHEQIRKKVLAVFPDAEFSFEEAVVWSPWETKETTVRASVTRDNELTAVECRYHNRDACPELVHTVAKILIVKLVTDRS
jgi:hypothetical protein